MPDQSTPTDNTPKKKRKPRTEIRVTAQPVYGPSPNPALLDEMWRELFTLIPIRTTGEKEGER